MRINSKEYFEKLDQYLKEVGPNPGTSFYGAMAWASLKEDEFIQRETEAGTLEDEIQ